MWAGTGLWIWVWQSARAAMAEIAPSLRFYLGEPVWWHPGWSLNSIVRTSGCALLLSFCSATMARLINPENSFALGLWLGCTAAALLLWACALGAATALALWFALWAARTYRRRGRCRRILRANGWPRVLISPRLLEFADPVWGRLPPHEHFALTPWGSQWPDRRAQPLNLYAALLLAEELYLSRAGTEEGPEEIAAGRMRDLVRMLNATRDSREENK